MTTSTSRNPRVFLARLVGLRVFDPQGDTVGRVRDVVIQLLDGVRQPRVHGLVVEVAARHRVFVPMTRVTSIDAGAVITTGVVNLRRFQPRQGETLFIAELLDREAHVVKDSQRVFLRDLAMQQDRNSDWEICKVFVEKPGSGLRRRGETMLLDWPQVAGLSLTPDVQSAEAFLSAITDLRAADIARLLHDLPAKRRLEVVRALDDELLADILEELPEDDAIEIVTALEGTRAVDVIEEMDPDDAADLLSELTPEQADAVLAQMEPDDADDLRRLMEYGEYTAGGMMTTEPVILGPDATVAAALARVRNPDISPALAAQVFVVRPPTETPTGRYLGVAHIQRLLREPPATLVSAVVDDLPPLDPAAPLSRVTRAFATYNLVAIPVVDEHEHLLGAVTVDDVIDHMLPDRWRNMEEGTDG
ncbi:MAG: CBS domain-containing protein [Actinobacteria bacterium]|nr:CBS domain-containing protein [Actinomycetota bacterium]